VRMVQRLATNPHRLKELAEKLFTHVILRSGATKNLSGFRVGAVFPSETEPVDQPKKNDCVPVCAAQDRGTCGTRSSAIQLR